MEAALQRKRFRLAAPVRIFNHYVFLPVVLLAIVEFAMCFASVYGAAHLRFGTGSEFTQGILGPMFPRALAYGLIMSCTLTGMGLYHSRQRLRVLGIFTRILVAMAFGMAAMALLFYVVPGLFFGRGVFAYTGALTLFGLTLSRVVFSKVVDDEMFKRRILVYGAGRRAASVTRVRGRIDQRAFRIVGYVPCEGEKVVVDKDQVIRLHLPLRDFAEAVDVDEIVLAMDDRRRAFPVDDLLECRLAGIPVIDVISFLERETGKVSIDLLTPSWLIFSGGFRRSPIWDMIERVFDLAASSILLAVALPFMGLIAVAIKLEDGFRAPIIYRQKRVGYEGKVFQLLKFRSMRETAESDGQARWAQENDDRVTSVGRIIRRYRLDELPQLFNVLKGEMSFVGPRPERPEFVSQLCTVLPYYRERHCVKPGITGWAQLCYPYGASQRDALEKLQYDLYYVKNHNLVFDLAVLLQTAEIVLWGQGAR